MGILVCAEQLRLLDTRASTLEEQRARLHNAVEAGAALPAEEDALRAELVSAAQERVEVEAMEQRLRGDLALLTGVDEDRNATLARPVVDGGTAVDAAQRPDIRAFDLRAQALDAQLDVSAALRRPTLRLFGSAGLGDPGYDLFEPDVRPMLLAGIGLQWRILDHGQLKRARTVAGLQQGDLRIERDRALRQANMALTAQDEEVRKLDRLLEKDGELVDLRASVARAKSEQLALGTATASDYITELNKESAARLGLEIHQLQRLLAQRVRLNLAGQ
jgi:outer membrane protein TolC